MPDDEQPALRHLTVSDLDEGVHAATRAVLTRIDEYLGSQTGARDVSDAIGTIDVALTGGGTGSEVTRALAEAADLRWRNVHLWYGDERWVAQGSADRNDIVALDARHRHAAFAAAQLHRVAAADEGLSLEAAASAYAVDLASTIPDRHGHSGLPVLDVVLLGVGPDGHVASVFPSHQSSIAGGVDSPASTIAVHSSPKPPPERISLTLSMIRSASHVILLACGAEKAQAVRRILAGDDVPAAHARGTRSTLLISTPTPPEAPR